MPAALAKEIAKRVKNGSVSVSLHETKYGEQVHVEPRREVNEALLDLKKQAKALKLDATNRAVGEFPHVIISEGDGGRNWKKFVDALKEKRLV